MRHLTGPIRIAAAAVVALLLGFVGGARLAHAAGDGWIVELEAAPAARWAAEQRAAGQPVDDAAIQARRDALTAAQDELLAALDADGIELVVQQLHVPGFDGSLTSIDQRWTLVYNGVAIDAEPAAVDAIASRPGVRAVHPNRTLRLTLNRSVAYVNAPELYGAIAELDASDDLREGVEGYGINIAVIDSGIDWSHPAFGGDPSPPRLGVAPATAATDSNEKVIYYLPLVDGVLDDYGHGTHVAATAAGYRAWAPGPDGIPLTDDDVAHHGVAPQARVMGYKACNAAGLCVNTDTLTAIEDAVSPRTLTGFSKPVAHVINMSLGGSGGPDDTTSVAADNAALLGTVVVAAAGNDGPGRETLGSPAAGRRVIAVAASNDVGVFPHRIEPLELDGESPRADGEPIAASFATDSNATQPYDGGLTERYVFAGIADTPDQVPASVLGRICLVARGSTVEAADNGTGLFGNKAAQCSAKGAIAVVIFNDAPGEIGPVLAPAAIPVFTVSGEAGVYLNDTVGYDDDGLSNATLRLDGPSPALFSAAIAGFSSRGPVEGLGQVKPDVAAPGVDVLAATTMVGAPAASMQDASRFTVASGTSMATPHVAGAAALIKAANPSWSPDRIRAALTNAATTPRDATGTPEADGPTTDSILEQGGGVVDVPDAANATAVMGVPGDGIVHPTLLAGHSFGVVPAINTRVTHTESVQVKIEELAGDTAIWDLDIANNRDLQIDGIDAVAEPASLTLSGGGSASFEVALSYDGDAVRQGPLETMFYATATRRDTGETLRMPFYLRPIRSLPLAAVGSLVEVHSGLVPAMDAGEQLAEDVSYVDIPVEADPATYSIEAQLEFDALFGLADLDLFLFDPAGNELASAASADAPERLEATIAELGTYTLRVVGWAGAATEFTLTVTQHLGALPPTLETVEGDWVDADHRSVDFDGAVALRWTPRGEASRFEIERSDDGGASWTAIAEVGGQTTSFEPPTLAEGEYRFRVRSHVPAQIGVFVSNPSEERVVLVDRRRKTNITNRVATAIESASFEDGVFEIDLRMTNDDDRTYYPLVELSIRKIHSSSGSVTVLNADNGGSGVSWPSRAIFDYSDRIGTDARFTPGETTGTRTIRFANPAAELFTFRAKITAYRQQGDTPEGDGGGDASGPASEAANDPTDDGAGLDEQTYVLDVICSPLTGSVMVNVIEELQQPL